MPVFISSFSHDGSRNNPSSRIAKIAKPDRLYFIVCIFLILLGFLFIRHNADIINTYIRSTCGTGDTSVINKEGETAIIALGCHLQVATCMVKLELRQWHRYGHPSFGHVCTCLLPGSPETARCGTITNIAVGVACGPGSEDHLQSQRFPGLRHIDLELKC